MKIKTSAGTILESSNKLVIEQWKKYGKKDVSGESRGRKKEYTEE